MTLNSCRKTTLLLLFFSSLWDCVYSFSQKSPSAVNLMENGERQSEHYPSFVETLPSIKDKTVVITGCSRGLGYVTASTVIQKGGSVIMLNRKSERAAQALSELTNIANDAETTPPKQVDCDLLSFDNVKQACKEVQKLTKDTGIDVLVLNAGIMLQDDVASKDGYDITASTNMLSHFLIAKELWPQLEQAAALSSEGEARLVCMSSISGFGPPEFNPAFFEQRGGNLGGSRVSYERYHQSKLANLAFVAALDDRLQAMKNDKIKALACHPGVCGTDMYVHAVTVMNGGKAPKDRSGVPSTEDGSMAQIKCIFDPTVQSGDLWGPVMGTGVLDVIKPIGPQARILVDATTKQQLWQVCEKAVGSFEL